MPINASPAQFSAGVSSLVPLHRAVLAGSGHTVATGQFHKQSRMVKVGQAVFDTFAVELLEQRGNGRVKAHFLGGGERVAQVFDLN
jgi:hypothetical protein